MIRSKLEQAAQLILEALEVPPNDHNFFETPRRFAKTFEELFAPPEVDWPVFDEKFADMVLLRNHEFWTLCPHHLLPVRIVGSIAYMPNGKVVGASKLARVMNDVNRYPKTQEALTNDILKRMEELAGGDCHGVAVITFGEHGCFRMRGIRSTAADFVSTRFSGVFETDLGMQRRFLDLCGRR